MFVNQNIIKKIVKKPGIHPGTQLEVEPQIDSLTGSKELHDGWQHVK